MGGVAGGGAVEVAFEGSLFVAAGFAEEVEFVRGDAEADAVRLGNHAVSGAVEVARAFLARAAAACAEGGQEGGAADAVLFAHGFGIERGGTQVGVAFERDVDQAVQARVGEVVFPAQGGGLYAVVSAVVLKLLRHGNRRRFVFGNHGAGRQGSGCGNGGEGRFECDVFHWDLLKQAV